MILLEIVLKLVGNVSDFFSFYGGGGNLLAATVAQIKVLNIIG